MLEVFTVGGGEYLVNTFNAVAAWSGGGGYKSLIRVVMVMGLIYSLLVVTFTLNYRVWLNWFLQATAIYLCLMVPTVDIKVTDRINPALAPTTVDNVPLGLGLLASLTTQMGDWLTRTAETVFVMPNELNYSSNGIVYGARLFDATRNFIVRDAEFSTNLENHFKNCLFGDVMLYQKSLTELAKATDLWAAVGPGSEARSQQWLERQGDGTVRSYILTCRQAYQSLDAQWGPMIEANAPLWGREAYPRLSNALAADKLKHDVPIASAAFTGAGGSFAEVMRQNTAINAFTAARNSMSGSTGAAAIDTFAQTRADIQARNTYGSIAQQAMAWVPILNIVLTVVFFAMFPVIFPLFLMPQTGVAALKGYVTGFFYLAAWGPLYVILHMICMTRATSAANGVAGGGVTLGSYAGIGAVNAETATIAGFMLMSVPFLAAGLARGAMSIAGHSMSMLAPAQNAAEAAALEQTTGNYSYGNASWANSTANMRQADQWTTAPSYMGGAPSVGWRQDNGATVSGFGNGQEVFDTGAAISRLGFTATMTSGSVAEQREVSGFTDRLSRAVENSVSQSLSASHTNRSTFGTSTERSAGWDSGSGWETRSGTDQFDKKSTTSSEGNIESSTISQRQGIAQSHDRQAQVTDQVGGTISGGLGGGSIRGGGGASSNLGLSVSKSGTQNDSLNHGASEARSVDSGSMSSRGVNDEHSNGAGASMSDSQYERGGSFSRASTTTSSSVGTEDSLSLAQSHSKVARRLKEISEQLSNDASYSETHGMQLSENLSQELAQWYRTEQAENPGLDAPELWATVVSPQQRLVRQEMIERWREDYMASVYAEVSDLMQTPGLEGIEAPSIATEGDIRAAYRPHGLGRLGGGPGGGRPSPAAAIIEEGRVDLQGRKAVAQTMRGQYIEGASDLRQQVEEGRDHGFFHDPKLRD